MHLSVQPSRLANQKFYAVQLLPGETDLQAIGQLFGLAAEQAILFSGLEIYSVFRIQRNVFVRFRTDLDLGKLEVALLQAGRGVIRGDGTVLLPDGKRGNYSMTAMCGTKQVGEQRAFRGTKDQFWRRQF